MHLSIACSRAQCFGHSRPEQQQQLVPRCPCRQQTHALQQQLLAARNTLVVAAAAAGAHARRNKRGRSSPPQTAGGVSSGQQADAAGLLQALVQLASRSTIMLGSHQAYAILESLEAQLPQQLPRVPPDVLASGLWAMARLQLQPQQHLVAAVAGHLLQPFTHVQQQPRQRQQLQPPPSNSSSGSKKSSQASSDFAAYAQCTRLGASCTPRTFGTFCYSLNFFLLRDPDFWAVAAAVAVQHLPQLKPANISNLLQGLALSGWVLNPGDLGPQQVSSSRLGVRLVPGGAQQQGQGLEPQQQLQQQQQHRLGKSFNNSSSDSRDSSRQAEAAAAVMVLLTALEQSITSKPQQLRLWRLRDISQAAQAYALLGFRCGPLFAVLAQHLLEESEPLSEQLRKQEAKQQQQGRGVRQQQQEQRPQWGPQTTSSSSSSSSVLAAAYPSGAATTNGFSNSSSSSSTSSSNSWAESRALAKPWHDKGRGPTRLTECRAGEAVGLAWAYVHAFCPNQLLLYELGFVLTARAGQLHAADVSRLLWAYATARVVDHRMLAAVTGAVCEEVHGVLPRTAAGAVWALGAMQHEAPAFLEAAFDRLAACLEATAPPAFAAAPPTPRQLPGSAAGVGGGGGVLSPGGQQKQKQQQQSYIPSAPGASAAAAYQQPRQQQQQQVAAGPVSSPAARSAAAERPSVLQQLFSGSGSAAWLSGGPQVSSSASDPPAVQQGELALSRSLQLDFVVTEEGEEGEEAEVVEVAADTGAAEGADIDWQQEQQEEDFGGVSGVPEVEQQQQQPSAPQQQQQWVNPTMAAWPSASQQQQEQQQPQQQMPYQQQPHNQPYGQQQQHYQQQQPQQYDYSYAQQQQQQQPQQPPAVQVTPRDVAEAVWAAGRLQHYNAAFFRALRPRFKWLLPGCSDRQLVDVLWGLARLNLWDAANMDAAAEEVMRRVHRLPPSAVALTAWCFAHLRHKHTPLFEALAGRVGQLAAAQAQSDRAAAKAAALVAGVAGAQDSQQQQQQQQQGGGSGGSNGSNGVSNGVSSSSSRLSPTDARQLLYAAAKLGVRDRTLLKACSQVLKARPSSLGTSLVVSSLWGAAVAGHFDEQLFAGCISVLRAVPLSVLRPLQLLQIFQATTLMKDAFGPAGDAPELQLPPALAAAVQQQWLTTTRRSPRSKRTSGFARDVATVLRDQLGLSVRQEQRTADGLFSIDLALKWQDRLVAVEVDGPDHFTLNAPHSLLGSSAAKHSCLQARGWAVLSVPFYEWNAITAQVVAAGAAVVAGGGGDGGGGSSTGYQEQQQQHGVVGVTVEGSAAAAAAGSDVSTSAAVAAAQTIGVPASLALQLAAARAAYLRAALDAAVAQAHVPRSFAVDSQSAAR